MVTIRQDNGNFVFEVKGLHKLWAFKSRIVVPIENVVNVNPNEINPNWKIVGLKIPGTHLPGLITAGTYIIKNETVFYDVVNYKKSIVVELKNERYKRLIVQVEDVEEALNTLRFRSTGSGTEAHG